MRRTSGKSAASKKRMLQAAGAAFREHGLGGVGVDGLAKAADLSSGAFYFHFESKHDAFVQSLEDGLGDLNAGISHFQRETEGDWIRAFSDFYLGYKRTCEMKDGCALPLLSAEAERAGDDARTVYESGLLAILTSVGEGLTDGSVMSSREKSIVLMALLAGGVTMSRTVLNPLLSHEISEAVKKAVLRLASE